MNTKSIIEKSGISFGTSGARGLVKNFTPKVCAAFSIAFVKSIQKEFAFNIVALAIDNRPSSYEIAKACAAGLRKLNIKVIYYGVLPTPALAYKAMLDNMPSIMVTGSHIPFDRNGLKFYRPDGEITKADEISILNKSEKFDFLNIRLTELTESSDAKNTYIKRYTDLFDSNALKGKKIGIYEHSSAGRDIYRDLFEELGAEVISLDRSSNFVPIDTEAVSQLDKEKAATWSKEFCLDAIFSTDGDGDRPLVADENGNWMCGDLLGLLASKLLKIEAVVIPVSCNTSIERSAFFQEVIRTKIGSPYVISEFNKLKQKFKLIAGFEANGGYILGSDILVNGRLLKALPTRDALLPALLVFAESETISKLQNLLPDRFTASDRLINFNRVNSDCLLSSIKNDPSSFLEKLKINTSFAHLDSLDGLRLTTKEGDVIHLRPSGNAPELRCYTESTSKLKAELLVKNVFSFVKFQQIKI